MGKLFNRRRGNPKTSKSSGISEISAEAIKEGGYQFFELRLELIEQVWEKGQLPEDWTEVRKCSLFKKGENYCMKTIESVALLETSYKILTHYVKKRLNRF